MMSSVMPSARNSCSASFDRLLKGRTAIDGRSMTTVGAADGGGVALAVESGDDAGRPEGPPSFAAVELGADSAFEPAQATITTIGRPSASSTSTA